MYKYLKTLCIVLWIIYDTVDSSLLRIKIVDKHEVDMGFQTPLGFPEDISQPVCGYSSAFGSLISVLPDPYLVSQPFPSLRAPTYRIRWETLIGE